LLSEEYVTTPEAFSGTFKEGEAEEYVTTPVGSASDVLEG
tara:strand:+ start:364 stop:483 length:120 start_codon:yes stop_codon:yes gene_type:complete